MTKVFDSATGPVPVSNGGTGATATPQARSNLGLLEAAERAVASPTAANIGDLIGYADDGSGNPILKLLDLALVSFDDGANYAPIVDFGDNTTTGQGQGFYVSLFDRIYLFFNLSQAPFSSNTTVNWIWPVTCDNNVYAHAVPVITQQNGTVVTVTTNSYAADGATFSCNIIEDGGSVSRFTQDPVIMLFGIGIKVAPE